MLYKDLDTSNRSWMISAAPNCFIWWSWQIQGDLNISRMISAAPNCFIWWPWQIQGDLHISRMISTASDWLRFCHVSLHVSLILFHGFFVAFLWGSHHIFTARELMQNNSDKKLGKYLFLSMAVNYKNYSKYVVWSIVCSMVYLRQTLQKLLFSDFGRLKHLWPFDEIFLNYLSSYVHKVPIVPCCSQDDNCTAEKEFSEPCTSQQLPEGELCFRFKSINVHVQR